VNRTCPPVLALGTIRLFETGNLLLLSRVQGLSAVQGLPPVTFSPLLEKTAEALGLTEVIKPASISEARVEVEEEGEVTETPDEVEVTIKLSETDFDILGLSPTWSSEPSEAAAVLRERRLLAAGSKPRSSIAEVDRW
jgi:hypothetical protein